MINTGRAIILISIVVLTFGINACKSETQKKAGTAGHKLAVITTLFPVYDFTRQIAGDKAEVALLLPPGTEAHSFDPTPADIVAASKADLFIFTSAAMEPWVAKVLRNAGERGPLPVDASAGIPLLGSSEADGAADDHGGKDPHVWLDPVLAVKMAENIRDGLIARDPANSRFYVSSAMAYIEKLRQLDKTYADRLNSCRSRLIVSGGHRTFRYLAERYGLTYMTAYGLSPNSEPAPGRLLSLAKALKENRTRHLFFEELLTPRIAETIAKETGAGLLMLHAAHNVSRQDLEAGRTYIYFMEENLKNLSTGMQCQER